MIENQHQYGVTADKIAELRKYKETQIQFPCRSGTIQLAILSGIDSLIEELEDEMVSFIKRK